MKDKYNKGYTLLFSIIVASIVLSIAAFILSVSRKQFILSAVTRDSTMAIYAADSAIQCAVQSLYEGNLATSTRDEETGEYNARNAIIFCNNSLISQSFDIDAADKINAEDNYNLDTTTYKIEQIESPMFFDFSNDSCAIVNVTKGYDSINFKHKYIIDAKGYNNKFSKPCTENAEYNPRTVERAIRIIYQD